MLIENDEQEIRTCSLNLEKLNKTDITWITASAGTSLKNITPKLP
jgi:hypothetical protein